MRGAGTCALPGCRQANQRVGRKRSGGKPFPRTDRDIGWSCCCLAGQPSSPARIAEVALSELDRILLAPVKDELDRLAGVSLPVLVSGEPGTGRSQAAHYLHRASKALESELRSVFGASVDHALCHEICRRGKGGRGASSKTIVIHASKQSRLSSSRTLRWRSKKECGSMDRGSSD